MAEQKYYRHLKEFAQAEAILCDMDYERVILGDRPDIIIETKDGKKIGLEMTECHALSILSKDKISQKRAISNVDKICKRYKAKLEEQGVKDTFIYISFTDKLYDILSCNKFDSRIYDEVITAIEAYVKEQEAISQGDAAYAQWVYSTDFSYYEYVNKITYHKLNNNFDVFQDYPNSSRMLESECIDICINNKEEKLKKYKIIKINKNIDEYWLGIYLPTPSERQLNLNGYKCKDSQYSKVFLLDINNKIQIK